ncbi:MAG: ABC transporter ATP-binding protein [Christensenellales bacterium]
MLRDVSFTVKGGTTLGVLGETGSGKSTIALLLSRLYDPGEGTITIGGVNVRDMDQSELRRSVGVVLQEPFLFSRTVAQNIAITRENVSQAEIEQAAKEACLHESIEGFQSGYETVVGERGVTLSGGQKQRTAIARTLLEHAPIMVFDDALSAVDAKTDEAIRGRLREAAGGSTMILIAHRVATLMQADQIIVLKDGQIIERGTPQELLEQNGVFAHTARMQSAEGEKPNEPERKKSAQLSRCAVERLWRCVCQHRLRLALAIGSNLLLAVADFTSAAAKPGRRSIHSDGDDGGVRRLCRRSTSACVRLKSSCCSSILRRAWGLKCSPAAT